MKLLLARLTSAKQGQTTRTDEIIEAQTIQLGRGTQCNIHLPDARVSLLHASIVKNAAARYTIEATGTMMVDGSVERATLLKPDQHIQLGPYTLIILPAAQEVDLAFSLELTEPIVDRATNIARISLEQTWLSKRRLSWLLAGVVAISFLAWPIYHALVTQQISNNAAHQNQPPSGMAKPTDAWNPGPFDSGHASFGRDCGKCHQQPFVQIKNDACENCHQSIGWHFALDTDAAQKMHHAVFGADDSQGRCAACHRDHKGINALKRQDSPLCTDCHRDLKTRHPEISIPNVTNLATDHPAFKLSMSVPGAAGAVHVVRISQDDKAKLVEKSNLKFPHDQHLAKNGVRSPNAASGKEILECKNCHTPDETGTRFKPVTMKEHCQQCHSLEFEPVATTRQVPHGSMADVVATVNEFYAQAALFNKPIDTTATNTPLKNAAWVNQKARTIVAEMMEKRTCFTCHEIRKTDIGWVVAPIVVTQHWLPKSRFPHVQHNTFDCAKCHKVANSTSANDIAIPDIKNCRACHSGNLLEKDKARGTCETCHGFHVGGVRAGKPVETPKAIAPGHPIAAFAK